MITTPPNFSTDIILFLKSSGTQTFNIPEFISSECPIHKYEIINYSNDLGVTNPVG